MKSSHIKSGLWMGAASYLIWGLSPLYFKSLQNISSGEILCHRIVWALMFLFIYLFLSGEFKNAFIKLKNTKLMGYLAISSLLVSSNWLVFIYAVHSGRTVDSSLGYFVNPLLIVFLGMIFFQEKLNRLQLTSMMFALSGLIYQVFSMNGLSWISICLPLSFGFYGVIRKKILIGSVAGLAIETLLVSPLALSYLTFLYFNSQLSFVQASWSRQIYIAFSGVLTAIPLILFAEGTKRLPYSWMGFLQYINPTLQLFVGTYMFGEAFGIERWISFGIVWLGLLILIVGQGFQGYRKRNSREQDLL